MGPTGMDERSGVASAWPWTDPTRDRRPVRARQSCRMLVVAMIVDSGTALLTAIRSVLPGIRPTVPGSGTPTSSYITDTWLDSWDLHPDLVHIGDRYVAN